MPYTHTGFVCVERTCAFSQFIQKRWKECTITLKLSALCNADERRRVWLLPSPPAVSCFCVLPSVHPSVHETCVPHVRKHSSNFYLSSQRLSDVEHVLEVEDSVAFKSRTNGTCESLRRINGLEGAEPEHKWLHGMFAVPVCVHRACCWLGISCA